jgi:tetratricopeptide (TPR) repeat protein
MNLRVHLWLSLVMLLGTTAAVDIPYVFDDSSYGVEEYDSEQLANISASSPDLVGVPPVSSPINSDILLFPVSKTYKTVGEIRNEFDYKFWQSKGQIFFIESKYKEALQAFDRSIQMNPQSAESWNDKGIVLIFVNRCEEALECYEVAIALDPLFALAWENKAQALYAMERYDEAILACDNALKLNPVSSEAWYIKALIFEKEAQAAFAKAKELAQKKQGA